MHRYLAETALPPREAVRIEELINYFPYDYRAPGDVEDPFTLTAGVLPTPWNPDTELLHIGLKGYSLPFDERPPANVVFLVDTSGSVEEPEELPLLKQALSEAVGLFRPQDRIAIVSFAGRVEITLPHTGAAETKRIDQAIQSLGPGGRSSGGPALRTAYAQAEQAFDPRAVNRIILIGDGDFNLWDRETSSRWELAKMVRRKRGQGIYLSVIGIGRGDLDDALMQDLAREGNGTASYAGSVVEARKVLVTEFGSNLIPLADDVRMLIEFNPARVAEYRLIGYETNRQSAADFTDSGANAGEIGSGHSVTVLYEITPPESPARRLLPLRYGTKPDSVPSDRVGEHALIRLRYKRPGEVQDLRKEQVVTLADRLEQFSSVPADLRFAAAVADFGEKLRDDGRISLSYGYDKIRELARQAVGSDPQGYRAEFLCLVTQAQAVDCQLAKIPKRGCGPLERSAQVWD